MIFHCYCFRCMFWTDWGHNPKIQRATMDGKNVRAIVTSNINLPNGLTIDYDTDILYFADGHKNRIEKCNLNGGDRKVRLKLCFHLKF